jgi:hypothetical protein
MCTHINRKPDNGIVPVNQPVRVSINDRSETQSRHSSGLNFHNVSSSKQPLTEIKQPVYLVPAKDLHLVGNVFDVGALCVN